MGRRGAVLVSAILLLCSFGEVYAQGFRLLNGRNHPELDWRVAYTEHFEIAYPDHLEGIEVEAAAVAEETYRVLSANLGVTFDRPIRIYLSDEDEIANGVAMPVGNGYTTIWVHANETASLFTGREKWLRKVIAHELAHIFHYRATRSSLGLLAYVFGNPRPSFWAEGLAQYLTEDWDALRGERWLRTAVLDDALSYTDGKSAWNGRLMYAVGHSQVRRFAQEFGDSTLAGMLSRRKRVLFGLSTVHDFGSAFKATTGRSYRDFRESWRRELNIHYNSLAGRLEAADSLGGEEVPYRGAVVSDLKADPRGGRFAVLATHSLDRPVPVLYLEEFGTGRRRILVEGPIRGPLTWSARGDQIVFVRRIRNARGSWVHDLYGVEVTTGRTRRLTVDRRVSYPSFAPAGSRLAFVGSAAGTANVFMLDPLTGEEERVTGFEGDVQLTGLAWSPDGERLAMAVFDADGSRRLAVLDLSSGNLVDVGDGAVDYRDPVWSPDGSRLAVTSLEDGVPNVFVFEGLAPDSLAGSTVRRRVTNLVAGASVLDWQVGDDGSDLLVVRATESKRRDRVLRFPADRAPGRDVQEVQAGDVPAWMTRRPPSQVPRRVAPDPGLVKRVGSYNSWSRIDHVGSLVLPYALGSGDWGLIGGTVWAEPLGKHLLTAFGKFSLADPLVKTGWLVQYVNTQFDPTIVLMGTRFPLSARPYGNTVLLEWWTGLQVDLYRPIETVRGSYTTARLDYRLAYGLRDPVSRRGFEELPDDLAPPERAHQVLGMMSARLQQRPPDRNDVIHPLSGYGLLARLTLAASTKESRDRIDHARARLLGYRILSGPGGSRFYLYGRLESQYGISLAQDYVGLSRFDDISLNIPQLGSPYFFGDAERVRGYRSHLLGDHLLFGAIEYRVPLLDDLDTRFLGTVRLGRTTLAVFADAAGVWSDRFPAGEVHGRSGVGVEVKNLLRLGPFEILHAVGVARPAGSLRSAPTDLYYRVRAGFPF